MNSRHLCLTVPPSSVRVWLQNDHSRNVILSDYPPGHSDRPADGQQTTISLQENVEAFLACEAYGSRPQAFIMWRKNGRVESNNNAVLSTTTTQSTITERKFDSVVPGDVATMSLLRIIPTLNDHKSVISCITYNPKLPDEALMDDITLDIRCKTIYLYMYRLLVLLFKLLYHVDNYSIA